MTAVLNEAVDFTKIRQLDAGFDSAGAGKIDGGFTQDFRGPNGMFAKMFAAPNGAQGHFAAAAPLDQLVRQEEHLGFIRELTPPEAHIGLSIAPMLEVDTDDVVIDFINSTGGGMAPARAQDAESETFQDAENITGQMRARVVDWALKSVYTSSDVMTYRQMRATAENLNGQNAALPLYVNSVTDGFRKRIIRDTERRKLWLDNRIEWLITQAISTGKIVYNDGKVGWSVDFGRPAGQQNQAPAGGADYSGTTHDPINDVLKVVETMFETKGVVIDHAICSRKFLNSFYRSAKWGPRTGFAPSANVDPRYVLDGWGPQAAIELVQRETGVTFIPNDNMYRALNTVTGAVTNTRFIPQNQVIFLPSDASIALVDNTDIGFAKTLTSPHPMANFSAGFYSWEGEQTDPWNHIIGSGIKAMPIFPHMDKTWTWQVTLPA